VQVVAFVPADGPVPPPIRVVVPDASACKVVRFGCTAVDVTHLFPEIYADIMDVCIDSTCRNDHLLSRNDLGTGPNNHSIRHSVHHIRVSPLSDPNDDSILDADIRLVNSRPVDDECIGDYQIQDFGV
jgi:hypothetical protein